MTANEQSNRARAIKGEVGGLSYKTKGVYQKFVLSGTVLATLMPNYDKIGTEGLIALIDDDASYRKATQRLLRAYGWQIRSFESAVEFSETDSKEAFSCLLMDIHMPGMSGIELLEQIRREGNRTPCIIITARKLNAEQKEIAARLAQGVLSKPCNAPDIIEAIEQTTSHKNND